MSESTLTVNHAAYEDSYISDVLSEARTIAVVGASPKEERPSFHVMEFLIHKGYKVVPINPGLAGGEILGQTVYASLADVPFAIDMVDIFRNAEAAGGVVDEALALESLPKAIWMQLQVINPEAASRAEEKGVKVVMDRCPKIEIPRLGL
ncbi:CoA-binding protein [Rhodobacteraceae bacterium RKSG542]|uniref:CoA-binding protein n=1 Tax=Pseudovibrio flavus TaxID=2529854 RepID=UPI0012BD0B44|nr:CoA-binding protein [Pseudovibrio flavus]MTI17344.1 CoA-binding protein [Pseudovibrio flavus]